MFRIGPPVQRYAEGVPVHPGQQFPVENFEAFANQWVPRWADHEAITLQAYAALIKKIGQCGLIAHSQGGGFALSLAAITLICSKRLSPLNPRGPLKQCPARLSAPITWWFGAITSNLTSFGTNTVSGSTSTWRI